LELKDFDYQGCVMKTLEDIKLSQKERDSIIEAGRILKSDLPVSRLILFGSKARGTGEPDSDIDLLILTSCPVSSNLRAAISDRLADINLRNDCLMTSIIISEEDWSNGLIHYMLIHEEVEKDGCEI
jgi:predicted nucleotidyltransferase